MARPGLALVGFTALALALGPATALGGSPGHRQWLAVVVHQLVWRHAMPTSVVTGRTGRALWLVCALFVLLAGSARAGTADAGLPGATRANPLGGMQWGVYTGSIDGVYGAYARAQGHQRALLGKIALKPLSYWFGAWYSDSYAPTVAQQYIGNQTGGNPDVLAQVTIFRVNPWETCSSTFGPSAQASYRRWVDGFAAGIGDSRVALILQPDLPFALCQPFPSQALGLVGYAAKRFNAHRHTTVYVDAGAAAWKSPRQAAAMLARAGVRHARGFALNVSQYGSTSLELGYGAQVVHALAADGIPGKHFVVNTSENGAPFLAGQYAGNINNPRVCRSRHDTVCDTLGIPPTWHTADARWHLGPAARAIARRYADAYVWAGRTWLENGAGPFNLHRALGLAATSPF
jgi:endoglucanase